MITILLGQTELTLLAGRAAVVRSSGTLYVADVHLGKASAFARGGVPLSGELLERSTAADLSRLTLLIRASSARRLIVLGDLLHARSGRDPHTLSQIARWRDTHPDLQAILVRGNHDQQAGDPPREAGFVCVDEPYGHDGLHLCHFPRKDPPEAPTLAGHLHPSVHLRGVGDRARTTCFWLSGRQLVFPAFGGFTGAAAIQPSAGDRVFAVGSVDQGIHEVPVVTAGSSPARWRGGSRVR